MIHDYVLTDILVAADEYEAHLYLVLKDRLYPTDEYTVSTELVLTDRVIPTDQYLVSVQGTRTIYHQGTPLNNFTGYVESQYYVDPGVTPPALPTPGSSDTVTAPGPFIVEKNYLEQRVILSLGEYDLSLPPPDFGDKEAFRHKRVNATSRGGGLIIFQDPRFAPVANKFTFTFSKLTWVEAQLLLAFLRNTVAVPVQYTDVYGFIHTVLITNPDTPATEVSSNNFSISIELQESLFNA